MPRLLPTAVGLLLASTALQLGVTTAPSAAAEDPTHSVAVSGSDVSSYPGYAPGIDRYAVRTDQTTDGTVTVTASTTDPDGVVTVDGRPVAGGAPVDVSGLEVGDEISVSIQDSGGTTHQSFIYLPAGFPALTSTGARPGNSPPYVFLGLGSFQSTTSFQTVVDEYGVPVYVRETLEPHDFTAQSNGPTYTVFEPVKESPTDAEYGYRVLELDDHFRQTGVRRLTPVPGLGVVPDDTDFHDVQYLDDGRIVMVGYHRDLRAGGPWLDAIIEIVEANGTVDFVWDSKSVVDDPRAEGYVFGAKDEDYAHINSVQMLANGDLLASFRNLGQVMRIATTARDGHQPGDVIWRMGGEANDFTFDDPGYAGFCAQHDARLLPNGHLMIFDNGSRYDGAGALGGQTANMCPDPTNPGGPRVARPQTRVVEYTLDESAHTATRVWSYEVPGRYAAFAGNAQRLANDNTLVGWSNSQNVADPTPAPITSEVSAAGQELWSLTAQGWFSYRAFTYDAPDRINPSLQVTAPAEGGVYDQGDTVLADYGCSDRGGSNLQSCAGPVPAGQPLAATPGNHSFTISATDGAGNTRQRTIHYRVRPTFQPDQSIRKPGGRWIGDDVVGGFGHQQVGFTVSRAGARRTARIRVVNDGLEPDRFDLVGSPGNAAYLIRYVHDGTDISTRVIKGTWRTPLLEPGESYRLTVVLRRTDRSAPRSERTARVKAISRADDSRRDTVAATIRAR